ncbi:MAG: flagellar hook-length control protein FliK [Burkholderiales bacterium]|nr:flagellar hook-length control protein FliK [Burkholderiales bacterium]
MPNLTQNSSLVNQISQIFSGNSSASNSHPQVESKPKESFNKVYKNELANGARKPAEVTKPSSKNITPQTNIDKSGKTQQSDETQTLKKQIIDDEDGHLSTENMTLSDTSSLLDLVDHIAAITQQAIGKSDRDDAADGGKDVALASLKQSVFSAGLTKDPTEDTLDTSQTMSIDKFEVSENLNKVVIDATENTTNTESMSDVSSNQVRQGLQNNSDLKFEIAQQSFTSTNVQTQKPLSSAPPISTGLPLQDIKSSSPQLEISDSADKNLQLVPQVAMPIALATQKNTSNGIDSTKESLSLNDNSATLRTVQDAPIAKNNTLSKTLPTPLQTAENNVTNKFTNAPITENEGTKISSDEALGAVIDRSPENQILLSSNKSNQATDELSSRDLLNKELTNKVSDKGANYSEKTQINTSATITVTGLVPPPSVGTGVNSIAATQMQDYISPRVGSKGWDVAVGQKMIWMVAGEESSVQLSLNPPDLGPLQVVLSVNDNQIDASFVSAHLDVREAIEAASPKLKEMMENAGISLTGFSVSAQAQSSENAFAQAQQQRSTHHANHASKSEHTNAGTLNLNQNRSSASGGTGLVDTFV